MELIATKILVAILLGLLRFVFGIIPIKVYKYLLNWGAKGDTETIHVERHEALECLVSRLQSFGGGVLFATCFLHMIPEVRNSVDDLMQYWKTPEGNEFPYSELVVCIGFFMVYFIEEFSHWFVNRENRNKTCPSVDPPIKYIEVEEYNGNTKQNGNVKSAQSKNSILSEISISSSDSVDNSNEVILKSSKTFRKCSGKCPNQLINGATHDKEDMDIKKAVKERQKSLRGLLVVIALSCHSIFEGLAIGLQKSTGKIWYMFTAICVHSATILYCIGFEMAIEGIHTTTIIVHMTVLAMVSPLGVIIGLMFTLKSNMNTESKSTAVVLLEGLSAGTVLYITFFEVLNREKHRRQHRISRSISMLAGFGMMIALQTIEV